MIDTILNSVSVVLVFAGLIFFHELGHFLAARLFGIGVQTFSIGFGTPLYAWNKGKTKYQIAAIPLGGYVSLVGSQPDQELPEPFTAEESFASHPAWQRFIVIFAGAFFNIILAFLLCWGVFYYLGEQEPVETATIGKILPDTPASRSSLQQGDTVLSVGGQPITAWQEMVSLVQNSHGVVDIVVQRGAEQLSYSITPQEEEVPDLRTGEKRVIRFIGVQHALHKTRDYGFFEAAGIGLQRTAAYGGVIYYSLKSLVTSVAPASAMMGPAGIVKVIYQHSEMGAVDLLLFAALISVNLGVLNLLPIPVLDGGHLLFIGIEMIIRRPVPQSVQEKAMFLGLLLLGSLMLFATYNDLVRFVSG